MNKSEMVHHTIKHRSHDKKPLSGAKVLAERLLKVNRTRKRSPRSSGESSPRNVKRSRSGTGPGKIDTFKKPRSSVLTLNISGEQIWEKNPSMIAERSVIIISTLEMERKHLEKFKEIATKTVPLGHVSPQRVRLRYSVIDEIMDISGNTTSVYNLNIRYIKPQNDQGIDENKLKKLVLKLSKKIRSVTII